MKGVTCYSYLCLLTGVSNEEGQGTNLHYYYFYLICNLFKLAICKHILMTDIAGSPVQVLLNIDGNL